ncbi:A24 family peptidase [Brevundimonas sp.]|uniref:prepilin peptidase n=1 Tax=Brevundimonas sp. TaxID=1871086 RepID=UPI001D7A99EC|nr:A24 family peptidase [Brevundimonas sp.]MBA4001422.1 prepilin peptidase [Brevundimonas sp.]
MFEWTLIPLGALAGAASAWLTARLDETGPGRPSISLIAGLAAPGAALGGWAWASGPEPVAVSALLGWSLLLIAAVDARHFWLPDWLTLPLLAAGLAVTALIDRPVLIDHLIGAAVGFAVLWGIAALYRRTRGREGLGGGDFRLLAAAGAWTGWMGLPSVLLWASVAGLSLVLARLALKQPVSGEDRLPFGVFLALGIWMTWLYGPLGL